MKNQQSAPKQDNQGVGLKAGVGSTNKYTKTEQDGQNKLGSVEELAYDRNRLAGNE